MCADLASVRAAGSVDAKGLDEASGLVASRAHPGVLWPHNDHGGRPRLFALRSDGTALGTWDVSGATAVDWEDIAIAGGDVLIADIGDNDAEREHVTIWRVPEPDPGTPGRSVSAAALELRYPDGPRNAETLLADPGGDLYVITKHTSGSSEIYRAPLRGPATLERVGELTFGTPELPGSPKLTAGDISGDGARIALRTRSSIFVWERTTGASIAATLAAAPCEAAAPDEPQGEAIAWSADGHVMTLSEGKRPMLFAVGP
jgi:hypothetical protein